MDRTSFENIVNKGISAIPEEFLRKMNNVGVVIEDWPSQAQRRRAKLRDNQTLFGLYEGVPRTARGHNYSGVLPDKITIFQQPIERAARSDEEMAELVKHVVWHEIAHHFGMDEHSVRQSEQRRGRRR